MNVDKCWSSLDPNIKMFSLTETINLQLDSICKCFVVSHQEEWRRGKPSLISKIELNPLLAILPGCKGNSPEEAAAADEYGSSMRRYKLEVNGLQERPDERTGLEIGVWYFISSWVFARIWNDNYLSKKSINIVTAQVLRNLASHSS